MITNETIEMILLPYNTLVRQWAVVGSQVTCNPAPDPGDFTSDADVLIDTDTPTLLGGKLMDTGWVLGGSFPNPWGDKEGQEFWSFKRRELNFILVDNKHGFFDAFLVATIIARHFNIPIKGDRINLFQAILYGNTEGFPPLTINTFPKVLT